jgi:hypothetical protein
MSEERRVRRPLGVIESLLTGTFGDRAVYFSEYRGPTPDRTYKRKPIVGPPERPFAELQMVERLERDGWIAGWRYRANEFIATWEPEKRAVTFPAAATELLQRIEAWAGAGAGVKCWDVFAWKDGEPRFIELRRSGTQAKRLPEAKRRWRAAAEAVGVSLRAFKEYEWLGGNLDGFSLKAMSCTFGRVDSWARYRAGRVEFGGSDPQEAEVWYHGYEGDTGLQGSDLLWVLFHDNAGGSMTYWDIKQTRDRVKTR